MDSFEQQISALGANFDGAVLEATKAIYRPHLDLSVVANESVDVAYGEHERHKLDIYQPQAASRGIVIYVHGGGFVAGGKNADGVFYANIGRWLARNGYTAVLPNYRLATTHPWPSGAEDVGRVVAWVREHLSTASAQRLPVILWGQSAGATHVASWLWDPRQQGREQAGGLSSVLLLSGLYVAAGQLPAGPQAYFGGDESLYADRSSLSHVAARDVPVWLGVTEFDPPWLAAQTYALARAYVVANERGPDFHFFRGHNHVSTVQSLGSPQQTAAQEILRVVNKVTCTG